MQLYAVETWMHSGLWEAKNNLSLKEDRWYQGAGLLAFSEVYTI